MFDWLKGRIDAFFTWITSFLTDQFQWFRDVLDSGYKWIVDLVKAIFTAGWDMLSDAFCFVIDKALDIVKAAIDAVDVKDLEPFADKINLPPELINIMGLLGAYDAIKIIVIAIGIRLVLQLIPFTRLGS